MYEDNLKQDFQVIPDKANTVKLRSEVELSNKIIDALCYSYQGVYYVNLDTGQVRSYRMARFVKDKFGDEFGRGNYETHIYTFVRNAVYYEDQKLFEPILTISNLRQIFSRQMSYGFSYRTYVNDEIHYGQVEVLKVLDSPDELVLAFKSMDKQQQLMENEREKEINRVQEMLYHLKSLARPMLLNVISGAKAAKGELAKAEEAGATLDKILSDGEKLLAIFDVIVSKENDNREKIEEAIMRLKLPEE